MISYEKALATILATVPTPTTESVPLAEAGGRILARPIKARYEFPRYDQSAMDGIGVRAADLLGARPDSPRPLRLCGEMPAGISRRSRLRPGCAIKVFTGSQLPLGADAVVMKEYCRSEDATLFVGVAPHPGDHIRFKGEELHRGTPLFDSGTIITPPVVGLLAANGVDPVPVHGRADVTLITIGDELLQPDERLVPGKIRDANGPAFAAALQDCGVKRVRRRFVKDDAAALRRTMKRALGQSDVVVTIGGASVGDHDHVKTVRARLGVRERFTRVAIKPGKPNVFGTAPDGALMFGLPGNPVSALVAYRLFVKPALEKMQGVKPQSSSLPRAVLDRPIHKKPGRLEWVRAKIHAVNDALIVTPTRGQESHMLSGLANADVLMEFPADASDLAKGDRVRIMPLEW